VGTNEEYNPTTDTWTTKASMPTPRIDFAITVYQGKIYCIGGTTDYYSYSNLNEVYDPPLILGKLRLLYQRLDKDYKLTS
jgi:hypothetical protein